MTRASGPHPTSPRPHPQPVDQVALNAWVSLFQLGFGVLLAPAALKLQHVDGPWRVGHDLEHLPRNLGGGLRCLFAGSGGAEGNECAVRGGSASEVGSVVGG